MIGEYNNPKNIVKDDSYVGGKQVDVSFSLAAGERVIATTSGSRERCAASSDSLKATEL